MSEYRDPLSFDFGIGFKSSAERIVGERERRLELAARQLPYHHAFLDDCLRSIMPADLVIIGARTGAGKTELGRMIATNNASSGKRVHYFALEAEQDELERRTKFGILSWLVHKRRVELHTTFNYPDWLRGAFESAIGDLDAEADRLVTQRLSTLHTYYRGPKFNADDVRRLFLAEQSRTDLIVLDHLHYIDNDDDNENRGTREIVATIRDAQKLVNLPVILIVHLRKRAQGSKALVPVADDIHGSSDVAKISTHIVMLEPAYSQPSHNQHYNNTFFSVPKDRGDGAKQLIALCPFDWRSKSYVDYYTLGRDDRGTFEPLGTDEVPYWARRHEPMSAPPAGYEDGR